MVDNSEIQDAALRATRELLDIIARQHVDTIGQILAILIDDYTVYRLNQDGHIINVELLHFQQWVSERYRKPQP